MAFIQLTEGADNFGPRATGDQIDALAGNDTVRGGPGGDILQGGSSEWRVVTPDVKVKKVGDDDRLFGDEDNDDFWIGTGTDAIDGGAGNNRIDLGFANATFYAQFEGFYTETFCSLQDITVNLALGTYSGNFREGAPNFPGGVVRGTGQGTLARIQEVLGSLGDDLLIGGDKANDEAGLIERFNGRAGDDTIDGGSGTDLLTYFSAFAGQVEGVSLTFERKASGFAIDDFGDRDSFKNVEGAIGSRFDDTMTGAEGAQIFSGGDGADRFDGKGGVDLVDYRFDSVAAVRVDMQGETATDSYGKTDTLVNIEQVRGSFFDDRLSGDVRGNTLFGFVGNDSILGQKGRDTLHGDEGDDTISGGSNGDFLLGWDGVDELDGNQGDDTIDGGEGDDVIFDLFVDDVVEAVSGRDGNEADGGAGEDKVGGVGFLSGGDGNDTISGLGSLKGDLGDDRVEAAIPELFDPEAPVGARLEGGLGDDTLVGLQFGRDPDQHAGDVTYAYAQVGVRVLLAKGTADAGAGDEDTLIDIKRVTGSSHDDLLTGADRGEGLDGGKGDDLIRGLVGRDGLVGGAGDDTVQGGGDDDFIAGEADDDELFGDAGDDELKGGAGDDTLLSGVGGSGASRDVLNGEAGRDRLIAGDEAFLGGGAGGDILIFQNGTSGVADGGGGVDRFVFGRGVEAEIWDFDDTREKIDLTAFDFQNFGALKAAASQSGAHVSIDLGPTTLLIQGVLLEDLASRNFLL